MKTKIIIFLGLLLGLSACKKDSQDPTPIILSNIIGSVNLYDEGTTPFSNAGMAVSILDSDPIIKASTDDEGKFVLKEVKSGTYTLIYRRPGFGSYKKYNIVHVDTENTYLTEIPSLGQKTSTSVGLLIANAYADSVILTVSVYPNASINNPRYIRVFFGENQDLSSEIFDYYTEILVTKNNPFELKFTSAELQSFGFPTGQKVYVNVAGESYFSNEYYDPDLERQIFPNLFWTNGGAAFIIP